MEFIKNEHEKESISNLSLKDEFYFYYEHLKTLYESDTEFHNVLEFEFDLYHTMYIRRERTIYPKTKIEEYIKIEISSLESRIKFHRSQITQIEENIRHILQQIQ